VVLQLKRQLCGAQRPPSHHPWRNLWPPGGLLRVLCFNHLRAGGPALAGPSLPHFTRACCVYAPCLLGRGQFLITIGTNPYQNTYFIFFFTVFSYVFSLFSPVFQDLQNTPTEYNRIHCILNNTREYTQNTHRIHNVQKRRKVLFAQYTC